MLHVLTHLYIQHDKYSTVCTCVMLYRVQLTVMFADGVTRLEKMKTTDHLRVNIPCP